MLNCCVAAYVVPAFGRQAQRFGLESIVVLAPLIGESLALFYGHDSENKRHACETLLNYCKEIYSGNTYRRFFINFNAGDSTTYQLARPRITVAIKAIINNNQGDRDG